MMVVQKCPEMHENRYRKQNERLIHADDTLWFLMACDPGLTPYSGAIRMHINEYNGNITIGGMKQFGKQVIVSPDLPGLSRPSGYCRQRRRLHL